MARPMAATNRDLAADMQAGRFRPDLYYRLCADVIPTPLLREQLRDSPGELGLLLVFLARRIAGEAEAPAVDELTRRYCALVYAQSHNYVETARRLGLDRRTVKERVSPLL